MERAKAGLPALKTNWQLSRVARYKSADMASKGYFSHNSPTYGTPFQMMENFGLRFTAAGENIAYGQRTPAEVMRDWMNSPGHRSNIMSGSFSEIGVGLAKKKNGYATDSQFMRPSYHKCKNPPWTFSIKGLHHETHHAVLFAYLSLFPSIILR